MNRRRGLPGQVRSRRLRAAALAVAFSMATAVLVAVAPTATGAPPVVDTGFGTGGLVRMTSPAEHGAVVDMPDGGVVAAGGRYGLAWLFLDPSSDVGPPVTDGPLVVTRLDATGSPVNGFGTAGRAVVARSGLDLFPTSVEHGPVGTLVVFGAYRRAATSCGVFAARLSAGTGTLDTTFASAGVLLRPTSPRFCNRTQAGGTVTPDGRVLLTAQVSTDVVATSGAYLYAYTPIGLVDTGFGGGDGVVALHRDLAHVGRPRVAADGRIVVPLARNQAIGAWRLTPTGAPDPTFSGDGLAFRHPFGFEAGIGTVDALTQSGGRVLVAGSLDRNGFPDDIQDDAALLRFTAAGGTDASFNAGKGFTRVTRMTVGRLDRSPDGSVVVAGGDEEGPLSVAGTPFTGRALRTSADGVPDTTFGPRGLRSVQDTGTGQAYQHGVTVDTAGRITFAGWRSTNPTDDPLLVDAEATLTRLRTSSERRTVTFEHGLSGARGVFRACGATTATACRTPGTWYLTGQAWPLETHAPPRVIVHLERRAPDGTWTRLSNTTVFLTDDGGFRAAGTPSTTGLYRVRPVVPSSTSTQLTYGTWRYLVR